MLSGPDRAEALERALRALRPGGVLLPAAVFTTIEHYELVRDGVSHPSKQSHVYAMTTFPELAFHGESAG